MNQIQFKALNTPVKQKNIIPEIFIWLVIIFVLTIFFAFICLNIDDLEAIVPVLFISLLAFSCAILIRVIMIAVYVLKYKFFETAWIRNMRGLSMPDFAQKATEVLKAVYTAASAEELERFAECNLSFILEDTENCTSCELGKYQIDKVTPVLAKRYVHMNQAVQLSGETPKAYILSADFVRESDECDWKLKEATVVPFKNTKKMKKWF